MLANPQNNTKETKRILKEKERRVMMSLKLVCDDDIKACVFSSVRV